MIPTALLALLVVGVTAAFAYLVVGFAAKPGPGAGDAVAVDLGPRPTLTSVAAALKQAGLVQDENLFAIYAWAMGAESRLRAGRIMFRDDMTSRALLQRAADGYGQTVVRVTLPEGWNRFDMAERLAEWDVVERDAFLAACEDPALLSELGLQAPSAEGFLFPDTYEFLDRSNASSVVRKLVTTAFFRFRPVLEAGADSMALSELGLGRAGAVTLASIVEKEAALARERPVIAGVFLNRLRDPDFSPRRLQADPTVAYGCLVQAALESCQNFDGRRVTRRMTSDVANRYNTYRHDGLPPGPICNPGVSSLRAVLAPARHEFFYFVAQGDGSHAFSADLTKHNEAVQRYRTGTP